MASEFQKKKLMHLFNTFYDFNHDGVIEWIDFEACIEKICTIHGWPKDSDRFQNYAGTLKVVWEGLQKYADKNKDNQITPEEWFQMWNECFASKHALPDWQLSYCNFFFDISDTSGDNVIDVDEYKKIYTHFGVSEAECEKVFGILSDGGKTQLTRPVYEALWIEYILSDQKEAKGNSLFGILK